MSSTRAPISYLYRQVPGHSSRALVKGTRQRHSSKALVKGTRQVVHGDCLTTSPRRTSASRTAPLGRECLSVGLIVGLGQVRFTGGRSD